MADHDDPFGGHLGDLGEDRGPARNLLDIAVTSIDRAERGQHPDKVHHLADAQAHALLSIGWSLLELVELMKEARRSDQRP